jgi:hypothetical protein
VRRLEQESDFAEVFEVYERDMARIGTELQRLRDENITLYDKYLHSIFFYYKGES